MNRLMLYYIEYVQSSITSKTERFLRDITANVNAFGAAHLVDDDVVKRNI